MTENKEQIGKSRTEEDTNEDVNPENVHSANSWESVDMGDDDRKKKFLRLMGASKKEHSGRFVIGDTETAPKHGRGKDDTDKLNRDLEDQYKHSNERKVNRFSHKGLGFEDKPDDPDKKKSEGDSENSSGDAKQSETDRKRESGESDTSNASPPKKPKMMMNFVKASD